MPKTFVFTAFGGPENQRFIDTPIPTPGEGQLVVAIRAAGVNPTDWKQRENLARPPDVVTTPRPLGSEIAGVVEAVGPGVTGFSVGDEIFSGTSGNGGFAQYTLINAAGAAHKPKDVSFIDASALPIAGATAYDAIVQIAPKSGETLLIIGIGGGVGIAAAQIAIAQGASVVGTASASKKAMVESTGAVHIPYGDGAVAEVEKAAPGGVAGLLDLVGGQALRSLAPLVKDGSRIVTCMRTEVGIVEEFGGSLVKRSQTPATLDALAAMVAAGTLKPFVSQVFPLDQVAEALALVEAGHAAGKIVIEVS